MSTVPESQADAPPLERAKPAFLRRVRIRGYKSIAFCDVALEPLTILVGRNASGKSNFLDALAFLADLVDTRVPEAVDDRRGWDAIYHRDDPSGIIEIGLEATISSLRSEWDATYSVVLTAGGHNQVRVRQENLTLTQHGSDRHYGYRSTEGVVEWAGRKYASEPMPVNAMGVMPLSGGGGSPDPHFFLQPREDRLLLGVIGSQPFLDLAEGFRASCVCNFSPSAMRSLQPKKGSPVLARDGRNLARAIEGLREIEPEAVERVGQYLSVIVEGVEGFRTVQYGDYETVQFSVAGKPGRPPRLFDAASMSDGTLRVLAALVAAHQIYLPTPASGFVGIEEPETSLHPAAMRALVDALDEATLRKQILLSTHSAEMLDTPTIRPENVRVVEMIDGQTVIAPVDEASVEIVRRKLDTLGGLERQNQLQADLDDLDRQRRLSLNGQEPKG